MGYSYERSAAAKNLLRARAHGHKDVISDAETLAWEFLGIDYGEYGEEEMEDYISSRHGDFTPEAPVITDAMVERAAAALWENYPTDLSWEWALANDADQVRFFRSDARAALEAALNTEEN